MEMSETIAGSEAYAAQEQPQGTVSPVDVEADHLTAPAEAVPTRGGKGPSLRDCASVFARQPSPPYLFGAVLLALALRIPQGAWSWRDAVVVAGLICVTPFVEWLIHVYLLHSPRSRCWGAGWRCRARASTALTTKPRTCWRSC